MNSTSDTTNTHTHTPTKACLYLVAICVIRPYLYIYLYCHTPKRAPRCECRFVFFVSEQHIQHTPINCDTATADAPKTSTHIYWISSSSGTLGCTRGYHRRLRKFVAVLLYNICLQSRVSNPPRIHKSDIAYSGYNSVCAYVAFCWPARSSSRHISMRVCVCVCVRTFERAPRELRRVCVRPCSPHRTPHVLRYVLARTKI